MGGERWIMDEQDEAGGGGKGKPNLESSVHVPWTSDIMPQKIQA